MTTLVCCLEERSAEEMLKGILPKILPDDVEFSFIVFEGKQDLEKKLKRRIQYWQKPNSYFLVMRDQDSGDCVAIKNDLVGIIATTGKRDRTLVRIACHELESFYLGDLAAVEQGLGIARIAGHQGKSKFRTPDVLANAAEELKKLTKSKYQKISGSRSIAPYLVIDGKNKSKSFNVLVDGLKTLFGA